MQFPRGCKKAMQIKQRKALAEKIATHILAEEPITLDQIEARAKTHAWYSINEFDAVLMLLKKDTRISATLTTTGIIYKKKKIYVSPLLAERDRVQKWLSDNYPRDGVDFDNCPFKVCMCALWRSEDDDIYDPIKHAHRKDCDSIRFKDLYNEQYRHIRKQSPVSDIEVAPGQGLLLLEKL